MADTFDDLGIAPALVAGTESLGWDAPTGLQRDAMAVLRRGNNAVLHASDGSGVAGAYGLAILDRLLNADEPVDDDGDAPRALVLTPDTHSASIVARALAGLAVPAGLSVRALGPGWSTATPDLLVAPAATALGAVRKSSLKLDHLVAVVVHGAELIRGTDGWGAVETVVDAVPGGAQRVLVTGELDPEMLSFVERHVRKAMTIPTPGKEQEPGTDAPTVRYAVVPESDKPAAAVQLLAGMTADQVAVVCRTLDAAERVERELAARGVGTLDRGDDGGRVMVLPRTEADQRSVQADVLSYDVPFDADGLATLHARGGGVLVTPRERAHLQRAARRSGLRLEAVALPADPRTAVDEVRDRIRALAAGDLTAELALLEPLLAEIPAVEVAAAAVRMARTGGAAASRAATPSPTGSAPPPDADTWVHLFMTIGERDGVSAGDIVGAITGEAEVDGEAVGKIDIRESHTTVEVSTDVAADVIQALNGRSLKGRSLRVDYDRKGRGGRGAGGRGGATPGRRP